MKLVLNLALRTFGYYCMICINYTSYVHFCTQNCACKIWPDSTCAISVRRKRQILLVVESLVLSTTIMIRLNCVINDKNVNISIELRLDNAQATNGKQIFIRQKTKRIYCIVTVMEGFHKEHNLDTYFRKLNP